MKVLICNKYYYRRGGDCVYTINLEKLLVERGHEVAVFAMDCDKNLESPWQRYFPSSVGFDGIASKVKYACRCLGDHEVRSKFERVLDTFNPDVVHLNNIHSQLSPVIAVCAHRRGIKVVWTIHDYKLLCPRYDCMRKGEVFCEACFTRKFNVLKYSCMKNSMAASLVAYAEALKWNRSLLEENTDVFICPSLFMKNKMIKGGFKSEKLIQLSNCIDLHSCARESYSDREDYYCYVGRLSQEKGVKTLVNVAASLPYKLVVVGDGPLAGHLSASPNVIYVGQKSWLEIKPIVERARFSVMPSECFENNPLAVIESLCFGTPVLGADIGGIPELISSSVYGMTFISGNVMDLSDKVAKMFKTAFNYNAIAEQSQDRFSQESYYRQLIGVYKR